MEEIKHYVKKENATSERKDKAINLIYNDLIAGATSSNIINKLTNDFYEIGYKYSKSRAEHLLTDARKVIRNDYADERKQLKADLYAKLLDVYAEARESGDRGNSLKALDQIGKVTGVYESNLNVEGNINQDITISFGFNEDDEDEN